MWCWRDLVAAVGIGALVGYATVEPPGPGYGGPLWAVVAVVVGGGVAVVVRRRWPWVALAVAGGSALLATWFGVVAAGLVWLTYLPAGLALYSVAVSRRALWAGLAASGVGIGAAVAVAHLYSSVLPSASVARENSELPITAAEVVVVWVMLLAAWGGGTGVRWWRGARERLDRELVARAAAEERLRIARELHDVVGHSMSVIAVKAAIANHLADVSPGEAKATLALIERTSRATLRDIRQVVGSLRAGESDGALRPVPTLGDLGELADDAAGAGVRVDVQVEGDLPAGAVGLAGYRIVQEALTNVVKHAAPTGCRVRVCADGRELRIVVVDDGPPGGARPAADGFGLPGMRERAATYGGSLTAGPRPDGGFQVAARLPYVDWDEAS